MRRVASARYAVPWVISLCTPVISAVLSPGLLLSVRSYVGHPHNTTYNTGLAWLSGAGLEFCQATAELPPSFC